MVRKALVGSTGFVGSSLRHQWSFDSLYHSRNIDGISGESFDLVVCAAAPATMWAANQDPDADKANLDGLALNLSHVKADRFVLISTIAVLDDAGAGYTESTARFETAKAYGRHRRELEERMLGQFPNCHVLRLPALFGSGLKKNFIFDLIHPLPSFIKPDRLQETRNAFAAEDRATLEKWYAFDAGLQMFALDRAGLAASGEGPALVRAFAAISFIARNFTNSASRFQYYNMTRLAADIDRTIAAGIGTLHLCSAPLEASAITCAITGEVFENTGPPITCEDMRSDHAATFGAEGPYLIGSDEVLADLAAFYRAETGAVA
ncbi:hypothetical protein [Novosphingobium sp.]|uniref:hypothetical protein n=1 Tax=Novosphingobium sp. TaxID=1874826 RepID=UPI00286E44A1|nr:hypothetical protein [Novosphingobium sp.]